MSAKWRAELPIVVLLLCMFVGGVAASFVANDRIPIHWNLQGEVDGYAGKWTGLMFVPLVSLGMAVLLIVLPRIPRSLPKTSFQITSLNIIVPLLLSGVCGLKSRPRDGRTPSIWKRPPLTLCASTCKAVASSFR